MVRQAHARGCYDALATSDIGEFLASKQPPFNLIVAADVFIYVGDLAQIFSLATARAAPSARFAFSVESLADGSAHEAGYTLLPSSRYAHTQPYIRTLASQHGWAIEGHQAAPIRAEKGGLIAGDYFVLRQRVSEC